MKLKKLASLCANANTFHLYDRVDDDGAVEQWLGDGRCAYPLHGLPVLTEEELFRMFDVTEKRQGKLYFKHCDLPEEVNVEDFCHGEMRAMDMGMTISGGGKALLPLCYSGGMLYIQSKYLAPLEDEQDFLSFHVRTSAIGARYVVVKSGLLTAAIIFPVVIKDERFCDKLDELARLTRQEMEKAKTAVPAEKDEGQEDIFENQESGDGEA